MTSENDSVEESFRKEVTKVLGITREMIAPNTSTSLSRFIDTWRLQIAEASKPLVQKVDQEIEAFVRSILVQQTKIVKKKVVHRNAGSMRRKRVQYAYGRKNKSVVMKSTLFKGVHPTNINITTDL